MIQSVNGRNRRNKYDIIFWVFFVVFGYAHAIVTWANLL